LEQNAPEALEQLDFGDYVEEPEQEDPEAYANDAADADAEAYGQKEELSQEAMNKSDVPAYKRQQSGDPDWKVTHKDLDDEKRKNISHPDTLAKNRGEKDEAIDKVEKDKDGNVKSWSHEGDWEKSQGKDPRGKVTHASDLARRKTEKMSKIPVQELAEFIHSFYDKDSGTFPKGPEGVAVMVGKKFGEQAEMVARKMVERMAPQQADPQIAELARMRELAGM
jgi:hypothetical protein